MTTSSAKRGGCSITLGLPWDETVLRFHKTDRPVRTASVNQVREPIYRTSAGRWRKHAAHLQPLLGAGRFRVIARVRRSPDSAATRVLPRWVQNGRHLGVKVLLAEPKPGGCLSSMCDLKRCDPKWPLDVDPAGRFAPIPLKKWLLDCGQRSVVIH